MDVEEELHHLPLEDPLNQRFVLHPSSSSTEDQLTAGSTGRAGSGDGRAEWVPLLTADAGGAGGGEAAAGKRQRAGSDSNTRHEDTATSTSFGLSQRNSSFSNMNVAGDAPRSNSQLNGCGIADEGSPSRARAAARAGPAPVLMESSIRRRRQHSRQASIDMAERDKAALAAVVAAAAAETASNGAPAPSARRFDRTPSYLQPTQSSLRHASVGSDVSMTNSVRRLRLRDNGRGIDAGDDDDLASVASSQWSVRRRRVRPRVLKPAVVAYDARGVGGGRGGGGGGPAVAGASRAALDNGDTAGRGGARVSTSRSAAMLRRPSADGSTVPVAASSPSLTIITVSDDDTGELTKSGVSVSLSPMTSGNRTHRKTLQQRRSSGGRRASGDQASSPDGEQAGESVDGHDEPVPRSTQPVSFDARGSPSAGAGAGRYTSASTATAPSAQERLPPRTPRGDATPRAEQQRQRHDSLGSNAPIPATQLYRLSSGTQPADGAAQYRQQQQQQQQYGSPKDAQVPTRGASLANGSTATHRIGDGRSASPEFDAGRKSSGAGSIDDTPISVLKERANREAERNARREASQPQVPRLALDEITAQRERQRNSGAASYKVVGNAAAAASLADDVETPMSNGSALSDVTVSPMTDTASHGAHGGRSAGSRASEGALHDARPRQTASAQYDRVEDVAVDPSPSVSAANGRRAADPTYDSRGRTAAAQNLKAGGTVAQDTRGRSTSQDRRGAASPLSAGANKAASRSAPAAAAAKTSAARQPAASTAAERRPSSAATAGRGPLPPSAGRRKEDAKCCVVM
ncbi:hypothetical protein NESM_000597200 [Novymonas esmeraldas]|uniref:Uncharacterized protein n=1 Tax=Novymonas esmeraldas TaxID=1808958 RepID=A0AAW0EUC3_9TRYP